MNDHLPVDILSGLVSSGRLEECGPALSNSPRSKSRGRLNKQDPEVSHHKRGNDNEDIALLRNVYNDKGATNFAQKEKIAKKILKGEYDVDECLEPIDDEEARPYNPFKHQTHSCANLKRHYIRHNAFELRSEPVYIHSMDHTVKKSVALNQRKSLGQGPKHYSWGSQPPVPAVPLYVPKRKSENRTILPLRSEILSQKIQSDVEKIKSFREHIPDSRGAYASQKRREIEVRKKLAGFKEKLFHRLKEKHDSQLTDIMRTLDDSVIFDFIEKYKGCTMSIDAILTHIGASLSPKQAATYSEMLEIASSPEREVKPVQTSNGFKTVPREFKSKAAGFRSSSYAKSRSDKCLQEIFVEEFEKSRPSSPSAQSMNVMRDQLYEEKLLPSMQPEKAISDDDLESLGQKKTSVDNLRHAKTNLGKVDVQSRRPPRSLKTRNSRPSSPNSKVILNEETRRVLSTTNYGDLYVISSYKDTVL